MTHSCVTLISEALTRRLCSTTTEAPRHWRASLQPQRLHSMAYRKTCYSQEHFGELMDVNTRHVIICDPQKGANGQPVAARGVQGWEKMSLRAWSATWPRCCIQKLPQAAADRHLSNWNATRRLSHQEKVHRNAGASRPIAPKQPQAYLCRSTTRC